MATAPRAELGGVLFTPGSEVVTMTLTVLEGISSGTKIPVPTTQTALAAHAAAPNWGDADCLAIAQAYCDSIEAHVTVVLAGA